MFVKMVFSNPPNILFPNLVLWCIIMSQNVTQKDWFAIFKVKVTARAHMINTWQYLLYLLNCWSFYYQTWFDSTLSWASVLQRNWIVVFEVKVTAKCQWTFVQMIFSESLNLFATRLGMMMHHYEPDCLLKRLVWCFQGQGQRKYNQVIWLFSMLSELLILLQLNLFWWYIIIRWIFLWKDWIALLWSWSRSQKLFRIPVNGLLDDIFSAAEPSVTKLGMVMQHHGPKCHARRLVCCLQVQGHSEGSFNQIWLFLPYLLNCWSFCNQI